MSVAERAESARVTRLYGRQDTPEFLRAKPFAMELRRSGQVSPSHSDPVHSRAVFQTVRHTRTDPNGKSFAPGETWSASFSRYCLAWSLAWYSSGCGTTDGTNVDSR